MNLEAAIADIEAARSLSELRNVLQRIAQDLGFSGFNFIDAGQPHLDLPFWIGTAGQTWEAEYIGNNFVQVDPVISQARRTNVPFSWGSVSVPRLTGGRKSGALKTMEAAKDHGFTEGLVIPFHFSDAIGRVRSCCTCFFWRDPLQRFRFAVTHSKHDLHLLMLYWSQKAVDLVAIEERNANPVVRDEDAAIEGIKLTDRERDVLSWAARGKTVSDTAEILHISDETVAWHTKHALQKLNALNKTHAVAKAIYLGLIDV